MPPSPATRSSIMRLMNASRHVACPCHTCSGGSGNAVGGLLHNFRKFATPVDIPSKEYAFEIAAANLRFGDGVAREVGMDFKNMKARKVGLFTDPNLVNLYPVRTAIQALEAEGVPYEVFDRVAVEPTDKSWEDAIAWSRTHDISHFLAVGGGSVMDTAKAANLFTVYKDADLYDFINTPVGKGLPITQTLRPLVAIPTTAGTGSETTGTAILDIPSLNFKTGIANRALRPILGVVDTYSTDSCPREVHISAGLDVLFHALESYTAIPYSERSPRPTNPKFRPAYQGSNPISDVFSMWALRETITNLPRVSKNQDDRDAKRQMLLASTFAGIGFGSAGVHLAHGMSYPISGLNKTGPKFKMPGYAVSHPIIPHGISVALTGPAVFRFTAPSSPDRHKEVLALFRGISQTDDSIARLSNADVGPALYEAIAEFLDSLGVPRGLKKVGYTSADISRLVDGTIPQRRVLDLAPGIGDVAGEDGREHLTSILEGSLEY
ncbi:hypothetical protein M408DRAFT_330877 [Serendipita vermifera MAFF 305830]|uniref:Uncharacterized protein n=1 Tax=Serendipita vermifera MAFF 305830 TaxID=933852 RepID=A0A0C3AMQ5_SERVB|nr:hypothetical protein M408DRAFT_330877 [Serendipita vermifera MAFF 305830]